MDSSKTPIASIGIIPARYASSRFPGKPLALIDGMSMVHRVYVQAKKCSLLQKVVVATDDERIARHVADFGGEAILTGSYHKSGTDRLGEAIEKLELQGSHFDIAINIQGDEPFIQPQQIEKVVRILHQPDAQIATLIKTISTTEELFNPNIVKALTNADGKALIFSRNPLPYVREKKKEEWLRSFTFYKHIGIYGYRTTILKKLVKLQPAPPELAESLEQLRWLWYGYTIQTEITDFETIGIDTPEDLSKLTNNA